MYIDKLDDCANKYKNTYHSTIRMKSVHVKLSNYIGFGKKKYWKNPKFKVRDHVRISKYKSIFAKGCNPNWSEKVFVIAKTKNTVPWTYL